jgi:ribosomal protein S18 acetylase RimI-like enzyme
MKIVIRNPEKNIPENNKENIFLAFDVNNLYLGSGFVFPYFNYEATYEHPFNIFIDVNVPSNDQEVKDAIFDKLIIRAEAIRKDNKIKVNSRVYGGAASHDRDKISYLVSKGFIADEGTYLYEKKLSVSEHPSKSIDGVAFKEDKMELEKDKSNYIQIHNQISSRKIDMIMLAAYMSNNLWTNFTAFHDDKLIGNIMIYEKVEDETKRRIGHVEFLFVLNEFRVKGIATQLMQMAFEYFLSNNINISQLEVWNINKRAVSLYQTLGYRFFKETETYPGINYYCE